MPKAPVVRGPSETPRFTKTLRVEGLQFKYDAETGEVEGFAAVTGNVDSYDEIIDNGAFRKTLREKKGRIAMAWQHNFREPIGKPSVLREVKREKLPEETQKKYPKATGGLYFKATISDTRQGMDAKTLLRDGVVDEVSIGYDFFWKGNWEDGWETDSYYEGDDGYIHLREIDLYEFSLVTMAANPAAQVVGYKSVGDALARDPMPELQRSLGEIVLDPHQPPEARGDGSWSWVDPLTGDTTTISTDHTTPDPDPDPARVIDGKHMEIIELIEDGELNEAMKRLLALIEWLEPEPPPVVLGLQEEQELRARVEESGL